MDYKDFIPVFLDALNDRAKDSGLVIEKTGIRVSDMAYINYSLKKGDTYVSNINGIFPFILYRYTGELKHIADDTLLILKGEKEAYSDELLEKNRNNLLENLFCKQADEHPCCMGFTTKPANVYNRLYFADNGDFDESLTDSQRVFKAPVGPELLTYFKFSRKEIIERTISNTLKLEEILKEAISSKGND